MPAFARGRGGPLTDAQVQVLAEGIKKRWAPAAPGDAPPYLSPARGKGGDRYEGARVFARACAGCHGDRGQGGDGAGAINNPAFLELISDQALRRLIITGRSDLKRKMPSYADNTWRGADFRPLTSQEVTDLGALLASWRRGE